VKLSGVLTSASRFFHGFLPSVWGLWFEVGCLVDGLIRSLTVGDLFARIELGLSLSWTMW